VYYSSRVIEILDKSNVLETATVSDIIHVLGINSAKFYEWMKDHKDFADKVLELRSKVDDQVVSSLLKRAQGYDYEETSTSIKDGKDGTEVTEKKTTKHVIPDVGAAMNWLKNRRPDEWRDKQVVEIEGDYGSLVDAFVRDKERRDADDANNNS